MEESLISNRDRLRHTDSRSADSFDATGVERERISILRKCIWVDRRRARSHFSTPNMHFVERELVSALRLCVGDDRHRARARFGVLEMYFDRRASSESAFEHTGNAFGSTGVERERT